VTQKSTAGARRHPDQGDARHDDEARKPEPFQYSERLLSNLNLLEGTSWCLLHKNSIHPRSGRPQAGFGAACRVG
jgi:hypothetical protein